MSLFGKKSDKNPPAPNDYVFGAHYFAEFVDSSYLENWTIYLRVPRRSATGYVQVEEIDFHTDTKEHAKALVDYFDSCIERVQP